MAITALDDLLSIDTLTDLVTRFVDQAENRGATALFTQHARPLTPLGESVSWDQVDFSRSLAPVTGPESPHTRARRLGTRKQSVSMAMVKVYKDLPASHLFLSRAPGTSVQDAERILAAELEDLANLIANTKEYLAIGALKGEIVVNSQTVPGSDVAFDLRTEVAEGKALASWKDPTTKLRSSELIALKRGYKDACGLRAELAITDPGVEGLLVANDEVREFAKEPLGVAILRNMNLTGVNPQWDALGGLGWRFTDGVYKPEGGPLTRYFPEDTLLVLPGEARLPQVLGWAEGKVHVPAGPVFGGAQGATGLIRELRGTYAYAEVRTDPVGVRVYAGWFGMPVILNPSAVLKFKVTP